ncbi:MAG TPA: ribonuclease E activity regulator RraA [Patescibacteria group bacterium]|nr:ribonuclease E activity regulator RraA [Patescibacteria group bacterium]
MSQAFLTADLYDSFGDLCGSCETQFRQYGGRRAFSGRIRTVKCVDDNVLLRRMLEGAADGDVLIVDGAGFLGSALIGDGIAGLGVKNGWSGAVIYGAVRDSRALAEMDFGLKALGSNPKKSSKNGSGSVNTPVSFGGITFIPGHWVYSDDDGILVSAKKLLEP